MKLILTLIAAICLTITHAQTVDTLVDFNSLTSIYVQANKGSKALWSGTGFFLKVKSVAYFITNNHVVGGKYHTDEFNRTNKNKARRDTLPDKLLIRIFDKKLGNFIFKPLSLFNEKKDILYVKLFENDADTNSLLDVVALPLVGANNLGNVALSGYNSETLGGISLFPGQHLYVIGYPQKTANFYPIWKSGFIASEPNFISLGSSVFYIDATTRKGMSGSPVVFRDDKLTNPRQGTAFFAGLVTKLVGIYSAQNNDTELGLVTRIETIYDALYKISF